MITSVDNQTVKNIVRLLKGSKYRNQESTYIIEGLRLYKDCKASDIICTYVTEDFRDKYPDVIKGEHVEIVSDKVMKHITDTKTPQGILATVKMNKLSVDDITFANDDKPLALLALENIQDPGNLGTIIRMAEGAGLSGVIMSKDTVDIYNPKVIRSTMGSIFRMPYIYVEDIASVISKEASNMNIYAAALEGAKDYTTVSYTGRCGILIGNEGNGLKNETIKAAGKSVYIPMQGSVESLNASISGAILMYEAARQRK
jgi:TrmH family RNA methyltransferase